MDFAKFFIQKLLINLIEFLAALLEIFFQGNGPKWSPPNSK